MTLNELIEKTGVTKAHIADKIGMNVGTFKNKLSDKHYASFTGPELEKIKAVFVQMKIDITNRQEENH